MKRLDGRDAIGQAKLAERLTSVCLFLTVNVKIQPTKVKQHTILFLIPTYPLSCQRLGHNRRFSCS